MAKLMNKITERTIYDIRFVMLLILFIGIAALLVNVAQTRAQTARETEQRQQSRDTLELIKSCTSPEGRCFQDNQKRSGEIIGKLNSASIYAAYCAEHEPTVEAVEACVRELAARAP